MPDRQTIHVLGEGGVVLKLALPLHEAIADRLERGHITRCNPDGSVYTGEPDPGVPSTPTTPPAASAAKAAWVGWAVACGANPEDAEAMTKTDLVERYAGTPTQESQE